MNKEEKQLLTFVLSKIDKLNGKVKKSDFWLEYARKNGSNNATPFQIRFRQLCLLKLHKTDIDDAVKFKIYKTFNYPIKEDFVEKFRFDMNGNVVGGGDDSEDADMLSYVFKSIKHVKKPFKVGEFWRKCAIECGSKKQPVTYRNRFMDRWLPQIHLFNIAEDVRQAVRESFECGSKDAQILKYVVKKARENDAPVKKRRFWEQCQKEMKFRYQAASLQDRFNRYWLPKMDTVDVDDETKMKIYRMLKCKPSTKKEAEAPVLPEFAQNFCENYIYDRWKDPMSKAERPRMTIERVRDIPLTQFDLPYRMACKPVP